MEKFIRALTVVFCLIYMSQVGVVAQTPQKLSYQAIIRNNNNALIINKPVGIQISILQGSVNGTVVYAETQMPITNAFGLLNIEIGSGVGFNSISWASSSYFIKTEIDPTGGTNYTISGVSQLLTVPYALQSRSTEGVVSMTQLQIDALSPVAGFMVYNSTSKELIFHDGTMWKCVLN